MIKIVDIEEYENRKFYNPYLSSVAFEIRYPSSFSIINDFSGFQDLINKEYPNFAESFPFFRFEEKPERSDTLKQFRFFDGDEKNILILSINSLTIVTKDYDKFEHFKKKVDDIITSFKKSFNVEECLRMGLRYINNYELNQDLVSSISEVKKLFIPLYNAELIQVEGVFSDDIEIRKNLPNNNKVTLRNKLRFNKSLKKYEHILDFDVYTNKKIHIDDHRNAIEDLKKYEKREFLRFVTVEFMEKMEFLDNQ